MANQSGKLYIVLLSVHGLIRGRNLELGRDADTGGQTLYVVEFAQALARHPAVAQVDLVTRRVVDDAVSADYANPIERLSDKARIVRIEAGPEEYIPKEQLWDHLPTLADNLLGFFREQNRYPDILHSHYADAGFVGSQAANLLGIPLIHTGHSLGRVKRGRLLASGLSSDDIEAQYNMSRRIEAEEETLATAERVITSTHQEIEEQYELYDFYQPEQMLVIPPGTNLHEFHPPTEEELESDLFHYLCRTLEDKRKPLILALSRPDRRKNIPVLVEAYGRSPRLQELANLLIVAGNRDDIEELDEGAREVFHELLVAIDRHELYGKVALPKHHERRDVPRIYRIAAASGGIFVNPALTEPFGLTLIEAAASGLPVVATEDGGPRDILGNCRNGILIDPLEPDSITHALLELLEDENKRRELVVNGLHGVKKHYSWEAHADRYLELVSPIARRADLLVRPPLQRRPELYRERATVSDLDQNMTGDDAALRRLLKILRDYRKSTLFILTTGRRLDSALKLMKQHGIPEPDVLITSAGSEIYYAPKLTADTSWERHIDHQWSPHKITSVLDAQPGLERQPKSEQSRFKISYFMDPELNSVDEIRRLLHHEEQSVHVHLAYGRYLDILPLRASKGMALRYVAARRQIPLERIFVAGGSGADEDMMLGNTLAAVVTSENRDELSQLNGGERLYFSRKPFAEGIIEALEHYDFFNRTRPGGPTADQAEDPEKASSHE